jgi:hypothetical protein
MAKGWKTFLFNAGIAIFGVVEATDWNSLTGEYGGLIAAGVGIVNIILRAGTTTPIFSKTVKF